MFGRTLPFLRGHVTASNPAAGKPVAAADLVNVPRLVTAYFAGKPDPADPAQRVAFGTSGHRGTSLKNSFNENHILATTQAICDYRRETGLTGPLFVGIDTHALAEAALASTIEVFAANGVDIMIDEHGGYTPTPVISHAILSYNKGRTSGLADGVVISPSHNPPEDGGYKYNPPHGGPADTDVTAKVEKAANAYLEADMKGVKRLVYERALKAPTTHLHDYIRPYVADLGNVSRHGAGQIVRRQDRHRSARRRRRALLAADHRALRHQRLDRERRRRSDLPFHDRGLGRQDPDGLFLALRDGEPDPDARQVRRRLCQRYRCRPPRHRDAHAAA